MLSFDKGRPIAIIKNGKHHNKIIYIDTETDTPINNNPLDMLEDIYKNSKKHKLSKKDMAQIKNALSTGNEDYAESLYEIITDAKSRSKELSKKEFKLFDDGVIQPLPRFNKTERCFIAGQTECGKTYYCKRYLQQLRKVHPDKKIFIISDVDSDPELDCIPNTKRLKLDDELEEKKPPKPEIFKDSIVLFDDIDSIQNKKVYKIIQNLRDSLLRRGRHEDISTLITSHLLTNYADTRIILNECNAITIFCRSGSTYGIKYLLKKYIGLDKKQIQKLINLPSRWVTIYKNYPQYVLYEKGIYIL
jgi:hypothetical protein